MTFYTIHDPSRMWDPERRDEEVGGCVTGMASAGIILGNLS